MVFRLRKCWEAGPTPLFSNIRALPITHLLRNLYVDFLLVCNYGKEPSDLISFISEFLERFCKEVKGTGFFTFVEKFEIIKGLSNKF